MASTQAYSQPFSNHIGKSKLTDKDFNMKISLLTQVPGSNDDITSKDKYIAIFITISFIIQIIMVDVLNPNWLSYWSKAHILSFKIVIFDPHLQFISSRFILN